ncbi:MAG: TlpA family protein disulfide reductase [Planctomycetaceae bacterium]|jgi:thiol-disulfide isomerase/thioredoxin|nr:TlpA family protein disulfide reductase [Planctomycetaceae bacterium]
MTRALLFFAILFLSANTAFADESKKKIDSLNDANSVKEIADYVAQSLKKSSDVKPTNDKEHAKLFREIGELSIAAGEKILKIAKEIPEQLEGYKLKISGLQFIIRANNLDKKESDESASLAKLDALISELEKDGRFPLIINNYRYAKFSKKLSELANNFSIEKFETLLEKAKQLSIASPADFKPITPLIQINNFASSQTAIKKDPKIAEKTTDNIFAFIKSDKCTLPESEKKEIIESLASISFNLESHNVYGNFTIERFNEYVRKAKVLASVATGDRLKKITPFLQVLNAALTEKGVKNDPQLAEKTLKDFTDFVNSNKFESPESDKKAILKSLENNSRRFIGANPEIYGRTLDDKNFDWAALRGKYVLVEFTSSWCGPCKGEIPGMISAYEKYRNKGFEIVSIYIWDKLEDTKKVIEDEKIKWINISEELTQKTDQPPQGEQYGIFGIPTMFIVGKDGKIIATDTREEYRKKKLAEIFDNVEPKKP